MRGLCQFTHSIHQDDNSETEDNILLMKIGLQIFTNCHKIVTKFHTIVNPVHSQHSATDGSICDTDFAISSTQRILIWIEKNQLKQNQL